MKITDILKSKTIWGVLIAAIPTLLGFFGLQVGDIGVFTDLANNAVDSLVTLAGSALAVYGRIVAVKGLITK